MIPCLIQGTFLRDMHKDNDIDKDSNNNVNIDSLHYSHKCLVLESGNTAELLIERNIQQEARFLYADNNLVFFTHILPSLLLLAPICTLRMR